MKRYILPLSILLCSVVQAGGHKQPPKPATSTPSSATASAGQSQGQGQDQNATSSSSSKGGRASVGNTSSSSQGGKALAVTGDSSSDSSVVTGPTLSTATNGGNKLETTNVDSGNVTYREAANVVQPATMIIQGCQVQGQAGGSNTRAAGMLGIGFTPKNCYDYIQAQAYLAIGAKQAACEILNHTEAAQRAVKNGAVLPTCAPIAAVVPAGTYSRDQVDEIVRKVTAK